VHSTILVVQSLDAHAADWGLELDQRMSAVVRVAGPSLARSAEVGVMAHRALVAHTRDIGFAVVAQRAIAVDANVACSRWVSLADGRVDGSEAMTRVCAAGILDAIVAVIPIRAVQALVADAVDLLVAIIADGVVADAAAGCEHGLGGKRKDSVRGGRRESMRWVVTMLVGGVALDAQVEVVARSASHEVAVWQNDDAAVASASGEARHISQSLGVVVESAWDLILDLRLLLLDDLTRRDALGGAVDDFAILHEALDQPVTLTRAQVALRDAAWAEIIVSAIADTTVEVGILNRLIAVVAVDRPSVSLVGGGRSWLFASTESELHLLVDGRAVLAVH